MEETVALKAEKRPEAGSKHAEAVRRQGRIPAIIYGHKQKPVPVSLDAHDFVQSIHHGHRLFDVRLGRKKEKVIVKDLQYDYLGKNVIHADLMRVDVTETVTVTVPIELKGTAAGTHEGGIIEEYADHIEIRCRVTDMPESIIVSVKDLGIGDSIRAADIELPEGVELASDPTTVVVTCRTVSAKTTEQIEEETPAAPEVITEAKEQPSEEEQEK